MPMIIRITLTTALLTLVAMTAPAASRDGDVYQYDSKKNQGRYRVKVNKSDNKGFDRRPASEQLKSLETLGGGDSGVSYPKQQVMAEYNKSVQANRAVKAETEALSKLRWQIGIEGKDPNTRAKDGSTWLHHAVQRNYPSVVEMLLKKGADPKLIDPLGRTPLDWAQQMQFKDIEKMLKTPPAPRSDPKP